MTGRPTKRDEDIGAALREARKAARLTQSAAGDQVGRNQPWIHRVEAGTSPPSPNELTLLLDLYQPAKPLRDKITLLTTPPPAGAADDTAPNRYFMEMKAKECGASEILLLISERIPLRLQAEQYTLLQYELAGALTNISDLLAEREDQKRLFSCEHPPRYRAVLSLSSLLRMPGGRLGLMREQALHLLGLAETYPHFSLQVLHFGADVPYLDADMTILKFAGKQRNIVYVPFGSDGRMLRDKRQIDEREAHWHRVQRAALSVDESRKLLHRLSMWRPQVTDPTGRSKSDVVATVLAGLNLL